MPRKLVSSATHLRGIDKNHFSFGVFLDKVLLTEKYIILSQMLVRFRKYVYRFDQKKMERYGISLVKYNVG